MNDLDDPRSPHHGLHPSRLQDLRTFWITQLSGLGPLDWRSDRPRPASTSAQSASITFSIAAERLVCFETLCASANASLQTGLLALVALLLHRTSRQDDLAIAIPVWSGHPSEQEGLIGCTSNTLPIRTRFTTPQTFHQLLAQIREVSHAAYAQWDLPFAQIMELLSCEHNSNGTCLVQVIVHAIEDRNLTSQKQQRRIRKFDLEFCWQHDAAGGLSGELIYASDLFDMDRMQRAIQWLQTLLDSVLEATDSPIASLNLLPEPERRRIESWQQGPRATPSTAGVHHRFEHQADTTPEAIALIFQNEAISYGELNHRANQLSHQLIALGAAPGEIVAVCLEHSVDLIVALLAILKAGAAYLALDPTWPLQRRQQLLGDVGCALLLQPEGPVVLKAPRQTITVPCDPPLAYVSMTSGSKGTPKGVAIGHPAILRLVDPVNGFLLAAGAKVLQLAPTAFDASTFEIWGPLLNGGTLVIAPPGPLSLSELASELRSRGITTLWLTAGLFQAMVNSELKALAGVRQVLAGGDVLAAEPVRRLLAAFPSGHGLINGYGPTEATTFTCCHHLEAGASVEDESGVPIGRPIANTTVRVLDPAGQLCPIGIPGELHIGGAGLALGYLHNPELTAAVFLPDPFSKDPSKKLYKSGDLVSWSPEGTLTFHGRLDQQLKLRGFRIEPAEIEATLLAHPAIAQAVVVARRDDPVNPLLIAYWVPRDLEPSRNRVNGTTTTEHLRRFLAERLPPVMVPAAFVELEGLPLTSNGKLHRQALPAPSFSSQPSRRLEPATERERQLQSLWTKVLGHGDFGCADNFFMVGGHSLAAMRLVVEVESLWGQRLSVPDIFRHPSIGEQAVWLGRREPAAACENLVVLQPEGERLPLYVIHGWGGSVGGFIHLARELAPMRPVLGLQSCGDGKENPQASVVELAAHYAEQILSRQGDGPIHLLGYSAGGWYAYAVAAALMERGARMGLFAVLDTDATARIHRRLGVLLLVQKLLPRFGDHVRALIATPTGQPRRRFLQERVLALRHHLNNHLGLLAPGLEPQTGSGGSPMPSPAGVDPFVRLLEDGYRPPRLTLRVDLFTPPAQIPVQRRLWQFYGRAGVHLHPMFEQHFDFLQPELMPELAAALEDALAAVEGTT